MENNDTGVAESVFIGGMFVPYGSQYADILEHYGRLAGMSDAEIASEAANVRAEIGQVSKAVKTAGWDGEWFVRAYDAYSRKVGTHEDTEGQIYIEPQGMCVMAGIGLDDSKAQQAPKSVKERLTCDWGTAILAPAYSTYRIELGEISSYPRGYKENGGIFCHNNPWISIANAIAGNDDEAFAVYQRNCPAYVEDKSDVRKVEPYDISCECIFVLTSCFKPFRRASAEEGSAIAIYPPCDRGKPYGEPNQYSYSGRKRMGRATRP